MPRRPAAPRRRPATGAACGGRRRLRVAAPALLLLAVAGPLGVPTPSATAQVVESQVYVDDSTRAHDLLLRAIEQAEDNPGESVRTLQELLDRFGDRLVPQSPSEPDRFTSVRRRALGVLRDEPGLLERHRLVERGEAERLLEAGDLERLVATRPLTAPGLEGLLRLGQAALESARFDEALRRLEEAARHPDLGADADAAAATWSMIGLAAHYAALRPGATPESAAARRTLRDRAVRTLSGLGRSAAGPLAALESLVAADGADVRSASGPMDRPGPLEFRRAAGEVIWGIDPRRTPAVLDDPAGLADDVDPMLSRTAASIADDRVFVSDGVRVLAVDRFTARPAWDQPYVDAGSREMLREDSIGLRPVAVSGDAVIAITGWASTDRFSSSNTASIVRLDAATGRRVWRRRISRLGGVEEYEGLFPHGRPWIAGGRVHVLARRVTNERLLSSYVVTLDLETGNPVWVRHVASVGTRLPVDKPVTSVRLDRGQLFVATPVGATAALDAATGEFLWLVRSSVPAILLGPREHPFEVGEPIIVDDRLVTIRPDRAAIEVRSREDGRLERTVAIGPDTPWGEPDYLLTDGDRILAVADDVRCFDADLLEAPLWRVPRDPDDPIAPMSRIPGVGGVGGVGGPDGAGGPGTADGPGADGPGVPAPPAAVPGLATGGVVDDVAIAGRVLVAGPHLLVPTDVGLLVVDAETGAELDRLPIGPGGAPAASGAQLVLAGPERTLSWMSLALAEDLLRTRIARLPDEPGPRLSLLRLAVRVGRLELVLDTAGFTLEAVRTLDAAAAAPARSELFSVLLAVEPDRLLSTEAEGDRYFDLMLEVAARPDETIAAHLARGDWLAGRHPARAIAAWQRILARPELAGTPRTEGDRIRLARDWAVARIVRLVREAGDPARVAADALAAAALDRVVAVAGAEAAVDPGAPATEPAPETEPAPAAAPGDAALAAVPTARLESFAAAWPFADAGRRAAVESARRHLAADEPQRAVGLLVGLYREMPTAERAAAILGLALDAMIAADRPDDAAVLADAVDARHPGLPLARVAGEPRPAGHWIDGRAWAADARRAAGDGAAGGDDGDVARSAPPAPAFSLRPPPPPPLGPPPRLAGVVAVVDAPVLPRVGRRDDLPTRGFRASPRLLHDGDAVIRLDAGTGEPAWRTELVAAEVELLEADDETILLWTGDRIGALGMREAAAVVALDAATGDVRWRTPPIDELLPPSVGGDRSATRMPNRFPFSPDEVIVRVDGPRILLARRTGAIVCLDRAFGDAVLWSLETGLEQLHELEVSPLGILASGARRRAGRPLPQHLVIDALDGSVRARLEGSELFGPAWLRGDGLGTVVAGSEAGLVGIDLLTGRRRWILTEYAARSTGGAVRRGAALVLQDIAGDLRRLDPIGGRLGPAFSETSDRGNAPSGGGAVTGHDRDLLVRSRERLVRYAPDGRVLGADAIAGIMEPAFRRLHAVTEDGWILLLAQMRRSDPDDADRGDRRGPTFYAYRVHVLAPDGRVMDDVVDLQPMVRPILEMEVAGDLLLLGTASETLVIRLERPQAG